MNERADRVQDPAEMNRALSFAESIIDTVRDRLLVLDADLRVVRANRSFLHTFQVSRDETERHPIFDIGDGQWDIPELRRLLEVILPQNSHCDTLK